jgi:2-keto-3-deoxy-L-rhamnonate aldolase RhmA
LEYHLIANTLDTGADGLIVPRIETKEQAARLISYAKFPPLGVRGCGTTATVDFQRIDWREALPKLNEQSLIVSQVESMTAIENLDEILSVPGIDVVAVGPLDLSINLGVAGQMQDPKLIAAVDRVIAICKRHNVTSGIIMGPPEALKPWWEKGMRFFSCGGDGGLLLNGAIAAERTVRAFTGPA